MLKSIPRYQNYYYTSSGSKKLYGLTADENSPDNIKDNEIDIIDQDGDKLKLQDFFSIGEDLYFSVKEKVPKDSEENGQIDVFYKQDKTDAVNEISELPPKPVLEKTSLSNPEFVIKNTDEEYFNKKKDKNVFCSDVTNESIGNFERFFEVNGYSYFSGIGLYFNVSDGRYNDKVMVRKNGLYFWPVDNKRIVNIKLPEGEIW